MRLILALFVLGLLASSASAGPIWTIGTFDDCQGGFDNDPHGEPNVIDFTIGDPIDTFPGGLATDIGSERTTINIHFAAELNAVTTLVYRWSPGNFSAEQFEIYLDQQYVVTSELRAGHDPAVWTTDYFPLPAMPGPSHTLTLQSLQGDGLWNDALELVPEPTSLTLLALGGLGLLRRRWG